MMKGHQLTLNNPRTFIIDGYLWCVNTVKSIWGNGNIKMLPVSGK